MTDDIAFSEVYDIFELREKVKNGMKPSKLNQIDENYKKIIEKCMNVDPNKRPTISEIVKILREDKNLITKDVNEEEYRFYIEKIDQSAVSFDPTIEILNDDFIQQGKQTNFEFNPNEYLNSPIELSHLLNLNDFEKHEKLGQATDSESFKLIEKKSGIEYVGKTSLNEFIKDDYNSIIKLSYEVNKLTKINHHSFVKFIGYSPLDFVKDYRPVVVTKFLRNYTLESMIQMEGEKKAPKSWNVTKKMIVIYGIASAMSYLHSRDIIHQTLTTCNILLDQYLIPKIAGIGSFISSQISFFDLFNQEQHKFAYLAPECMMNFQPTKAVDIYSFAIILYEMLSVKKIFEEDFSMNTINNVISGERPPIPDSIPQLFRNLIERCWNHDKDKRPTFDEIVEILKNNIDEFESYGVIKEDFLSYVNFIDNHYCNESIEDFINLESETYQKVSFHSRKKEHFSFDIETLDLDNFEKISKIGEGSFGIVYKIIDKKTDIFYAAKITKAEINTEIKEEMNDIINEVNLISTLNHPAILKFIGYSPISFKKQSRPVIVTDYAPSWNLADVLELERNCLSKTGWNDTKKLINIYGIASALKYLHQNNIIHRDLSPSNILLDDFLYPLLADFGISKEITENNDNINNAQKISGFKGTPAYVAPEIWNKYYYSKASDVYSFAYTVFEIMTGQECFPDLKDIFNFYRTVIKEKKRPVFKYPIYECYRNLIEKCWKDDPKERPTFDEIVDELENNRDFITYNVDKDEYFNYIEFCYQFKSTINFFSEKPQSNRNKNSKKIIHLGLKIDENKYQKVVENEAQNDIFNEKQFKILNRSQKVDFKSHTLDSKHLLIHPNFGLIENLISSNQPEKLIHYLNDYCDYDTTSSVFNRCFNENREMYRKLCEEGILLNNAVSFHKAAISLIFKRKDDEKKNESIEKARSYLNESIKKGFLLSYFSLARLLSSFYYRENEEAFRVAKEGAEKGEKYSKCLLGHFIATGIGTKKDLKKGVEMMLESGAEDLYKNFATEIGLYFLESEKDFQNAFKWFENAYLIKKTKTTINNYGLCFLKGIYVTESIEKAREIFTEGEKLGDSNSIYHLAFTYENVDLKKSIIYYKKAADLGNLDAKRRYDHLKLL